LAGTNKTKYNYNQVTTQKPTQQLMKVTSISKIKPNETCAWFQSPFITSGHKMDPAYSTASGACMRLEY